ncbi:MAG: cache domain-containing protein, partial [Marinobacterium sp.]
MINTLWHQMTGNLRYRLLALTFFPLLLVLPGVVLLAYLWSNEVGYRQLLMKANTDLAVAHEAFSATRDQYLVRLSLAAGGDRFRHELMALDRPATHSASQDRDRLLETLRTTTGFDFVRLLDTDGCPIPNAGSCDYPDSPLIQRAKTSGPVSGVEIFSAQTLRILDPALAERARVALIPTDHSVQTRKTIEDRGMVLHFIYPLRDEGGRLVAFLTAGLLMNGDLEFVDQISSTVYGPGSLPDGSIGTVTLFLDDVRISTNVEHPDTPLQRALGTRVSAQVRHQVLDEGERWLDRAFVVSDWYISAYEPVMDVNGKRVGMLYAGFLEAPFLEPFYHWLERLLWLFVLVLLLCGFIAIAGARSIAKPFETMTLVIDRIRDGERQRMPPLGTGTTDEVRVLAEHFNAMLNQLDQQHDAIQQAADQLEDKVQARTRELKQHIG